MSLVQSQRHVRCCCSLRILEDAELHARLLVLSCVSLCAAKVAAAQLRLGVMFEHGLGVKLDHKVLTVLKLHEGNAA